MLTIRRPAVLWHGTCSILIRSTEPKKELGQTVYDDSPGKKTKQYVLSDSDLASRLVLLEKKLNQLRRFLDRIDLLVDAIEREMQQLQYEVAPTTETAQPRRRRRQARGNHAADGGKPVDLALSEAVDIQFVRRGDGGASVCIDGGKWFTLQPKPAALLRTLLMGPRSDKPDSEWKSYEALAEQLGAKEVDNGVRHRIAQLIYLLRNALETHGVNPDLVQTDRRFGVRFRVKADRNGLIWDPPV